MIRHGVGPYLECSSKGDKRLSAFYAKVYGRGGKTIEQIYQAAKVFRNGDTGLSIAEAKGFRPVNVRECAELYATLWDEYIDENPNLLKVIQYASGLSDMFGRPGSVCQVTELWRIRRERWDWSLTCRCKQGKMSAVDGKCGHCRNRRERDEHRAIMNGKKPNWFGETCNHA